MLRYPGPLVRTRCGMHSSRQPLMPGFRCATSKRLLHTLIDGPRCVMTGPGRCKIAMPRTSCPPTSLVALPAGPSGTADFAPAPAYCVVEGEQNNAPERWLSPSRAQRRSARRVVLAGAEDHARRLAVLADAVNPSGAGFIDSEAVRNPTCKS